MGRAQDSAVASESDTQIGELRRGYYLTKKDVIVHVGIKKKKWWMHRVTLHGVEKLCRHERCKKLLCRHERDKTLFAPPRAG